MPFKGHSDNSGDFIHVRTCFDAFVQPVARVLVFVHACFIAAYFHGSTKSAPTAVIDLVGATVNNSPPQYAHAHTHTHLPGGQLATNLQRGPASPHNAVQVEHHSRRQGAIHNAAGT
eukprot:5445060-Amphidinium_carterae.1